jgi:hypothetical protein
MMTAPTDIAVILGAELETFAERTPGAGRRDRQDDVRCGSDATDTSARRGTATGLGNDHPHRSVGPDSEVIG